MRKRIKLADVLKKALDDSISADLKAILPTKLKIMGTVGFVRLDPRLEKVKHMIGEKILEIYPYLKTIVNTLGIEGELRKPIVEIIAGEEKTEIVYKEHNYRFKMDFTKVMFSLGNSNERWRMANVSNSNEIVIDMFAGIGQFTIPMAVNSKPQKIFAIDLNPDAYKFLLENIFLNKVEDVVFPIWGDSKKVVPTLLNNFADRVIMGYFGNTQDFLPAAFAGLKKEGIIHYHNIYPRSVIFSGVIKELKEIASRESREIEILYKNIVKTYSPSKVHVVVDLKVNTL